MKTAQAKNLRFVGTSIIKTWDLAEDNVNDDSASKLLIVRIAENRENNSVDTIMTAKKLMK